MKAKSITKIITWALAGLLLSVSALIIGAHFLEGELPQKLSFGEKVMTLSIFLMFIGAIISFINRFWAGLVLLIGYSIKTIFEGIEFNLFIDLFLILSILNFFLFYLEINDKN